ncbi:MAG: MotA/TolQ/ExbB proton channel family protein [Gammaproteobacteria bacterium]|nr:MotA/TolQ/ExbB proton channel family protein [Gammaproteobacteria bacterium]
MLNLLIAGGWLMLPLLICSIVAVAIIIERSWQLRYSKVVPNGLNESIIYDLKQKSLTHDKLLAIQQSSALGSMFSVAMNNIKKERPVILQELEESGRVTMHNLERNLSALGIIATISPLLGLLGTVVGMIQVFSVITEQGVNNANSMASGIATALITTAVGLIIAIPSLAFYRSFQRRLDEIAHRLQYESIKLVDNVKSMLKQQ